MTETQYSIETISPTDLAATDLRTEAQDLPAAQAARIDLGYNQEAAWALYDPESGRIGIAYGADATWFDAENLESGVAAYFAVGDEFDLPR